MTGYYHVVTGEELESLPPIERLRSTPDGLSWWERVLPDQPGFEDLKDLFLFSLGYARKLVPVGSLEDEEKAGHDPTWHQYP